MLGLENINEQLIQIVMQAFGYGFLAGLVCFFVMWGARLAISILKT